MMVMIVQCTCTHQLFAFRMRFILVTIEQRKTKTPSI